MSRGTGLGRWTAVSLLVLIAGLFSFLNAGERVAVNLGFTTIYRISLVGLVFGAFLLGMVAMFLFGLRHDRRIREALRGQYQPPFAPHRTPFGPPPPPTAPPD